MLHKIVETKKQEVHQLKKTATLQALEDKCRFVPAPKGFRTALIKSSRPVSVIAEVKKASPSKGLIRPEFDPVSIAKAYTQAEVEAISVLTDQQYFQGSLEYLAQVREEVDVPLLRKDFIIDEWQIVEARAAGADCILLIAAILEGEQIRHFSQVAKNLGMDVLTEIHDRGELELVLKHAQTSLLGINNRNLHTFTTSLNTTADLISEVPSDIPVVCESGISTSEDIAFLQKLGARAVLVGEHFMRQRSISSAVLELVGERVIRP